MSSAWEALPSNAPKTAEPEDEDEGIISQEDCWSVIQAYFDENVFPHQPAVS
jgi:hypothetical protein